MRGMQNFVRGVLIGFAALLVAIQFIRPPRTNPPVVSRYTLESAVIVPGAVEQVLARACADCHSDQTRWPWYSHVAPISWVVIDHVNSGRRHLNFSEWLRPSVKDPAQYTAEKFHAACRQMQTGDMPLFSYRLVHRDSRLSQHDIQTVCEWAGSRIERK